MNRPTKDLERVAPNALSAVGLTWPRDGTFYLNGEELRLPDDCSRLASDFIRNDLRLFGTKVGCATGDCGSCTILVDGIPTYACLTPMGRLESAKVVTIEGLEHSTNSGSKLQEAFLANQAVQCGFCIPGMLVTAAGAIDSGSLRSEADVRRSLCGVLCRCTGYQRIVSAVTQVATGEATVSSSRHSVVGETVGSAITRLDGEGKVRGTERFGADGMPTDALYIRAIRSPFHRASFEFGDFEKFVRDNPGIVRILTAADVPALNLHGVASPFADQAVLPNSEARHYMEAVALIVGERVAVERLDVSRFPIRWRELPAVMSTTHARTRGAPRLHDDREDNILIRGRVERGDVDSAMASAYKIAAATFSTSFVEHAYIEPEAGWARTNGEVVEVFSPTQAPHAHREDLAKILGIPREMVHVIPTAVGGGFGGKLDMTVQPLVAMAARILKHPVAMVYTREESIATSTKRHPAIMSGRIAVDAHGKIQAVEFEGDFNTGAYASWGTAVANRVPVHASGPYYVPNYRASTQATHTHTTPAGAFRGFGVPQTMICQEQLVDELTIDLRCDPLEFRLRNAIVAGQSLVTGQTLNDSVGISACLQAVRDDWREAKKRTTQYNESREGPLRRGCGIAAFHYGCGNTAMSNPSTIRIGVTPEGKVVLHQGAVDAGQGSNTVIPQVVADALGVHVQALEIVGASTHQTPDCGRTSASRQTFVTGRAAQLAAEGLRKKIARGLGVPAETLLSFEKGVVSAADGCSSNRLNLNSMPVDDFGYVFCSEEQFDPPTTGLDELGQGSPYAVYAFGVQMAEVEVDCETGEVKVVEFVAAHDVGRIINPTLLAGQVEGAIAQGIGMALMEKFVPGRTNTFQDYLIPTTEDMPVIKTVFIEAPTSLGPFGAKGIGEPALVPTAAAILNAIRNAIGVRIYHTPALPSDIRQALQIRRQSAKRVSPTSAYKPGECK